MIELLTCVAIIGVLASLALPAFKEYQTKSRDAMVVSTLHDSFSAQEAAYIENGSYSNCAAAAECEAVLPGLVIPRTNNSYQIVPMRHTAANDGQSYTATGSHIDGSATWTFDSSTAQLSRN